MLQKIAGSIALAILVVGCCCSGGGLTPPPSGVTPGHAGNFDADVATVNLLSDGRNAIMLKALTFTDVRGVAWTAPVGEKSDGASIPQVFWSVIGGPWEGKYRFAALVHDHYCDFHDGRRWQDVHRMFYEASVAGGTDPLLAKILYAAVYYFGPRWNEENQSYSEMALLIPVERARIAELTQTQTLRSMPTTNDFGVTPAPPQLKGHDQALLVLTPDQSVPTFAVPRVSGAVLKWHRILDHLRAHPDASLDEIEHLN
jgi:hypothetical protein